MPIRRVIIISAFLFNCVALTAQTPVDSIYTDTLLLDDGSMYMGQIRDSLSNGYGRCIYSDGTVYEGNWKDGLWDGRGTVVYPDGDIYKGSFLKQIKEGTGTYYYNSGARYTGDWKDDKFNGNGKLYFSDGGMYDGAWKDDMKHGYGRLISHNGILTIGYFYYDEYLGMPYDTEIDQDSTMTDELIEWGFKQEDIRLRPTVSMGVSYGSKGMITCSLWLDHIEHFYYGFSLGVNIDTPVKGTVADGIGWNSFSYDVHFTGSYISSQYLFDTGLIFNRLSVGGSLGLGIRSVYMNCQAHGNADNYKNYWIRPNEAYSRRWYEGHVLAYRGYIRYFLEKEQPKTLLYLGYGNADGLFLGVGFNL